MTIFVVTSARHDEPETAQVGCDVFASIFQAQAHVLDQLAIYRNPGGDYPPLTWTTACLSDGRIIHTTYAEMTAFRIDEVAGWTRDSSL